MQIKWAIKSPFLNGIYLLWWVNNIIAVHGDKTTCRPSIQTSDGLHFICYCDTNFAEIDTDSKDHLTVDLKDDSNGKNDFSLAEFAYNLSGAYFRKSVHVTFQYCRHLRIILDQSELSRIGSEYFRPDIQVSSCFIEHVYHLELLRGTDARKRNAKSSKFKGLQDNSIDEYVSAFDTKGLELTVFSVALVKVAVGANFTSLVTSTPESTLYIDINEEIDGDNDQLDVKGFLKQNISLSKDGVLNSLA